MSSANRASEASDRHDITTVTVLFWMFCKAALQLPETSCRASWLFASGATVKVSAKEMIARNERVWRLDLRRRVGGASHSCHTAGSGAVTVTGS